MRIALGLLLLVSPVAAQTRLIAELRSRAVTDDAFARRDLYSWTTPVQIARMRREHRVLWADADDGAVRAPYQRALEAMAAREGRDAEIARVILSTPALERRRYAWSTPWGAAIPKGPRSYGSELVMMRLREGAWIGRFAPDEEPAFRFTDVHGAPVQGAAVLRHPDHIASIFHVEARSAQGPYREYIVHNEAQVERYFTRGLDRRRARDVLVLRRLGSVDSNGPLADFWSRTDSSMRALFAATMPFDTPRHRPTRENLRAIIRVLTR
jgi:hypothetical protein